MKKVFKLIGIASIALALFFIVTSLAFYHLMRIGEFRRFLIDEIEKNTDLKVQIGEADLEIGWVTGVAFRQITLSEPGAASPGITAERVTARVALTPLIERRVIFYEIRLQKPTVQLITDPAGRIPLLDKLVNLPFLKPRGSEFDIDLRSVKVRDGVIEYVDQRKEEAPQKWRFVNADLDLDRVRGARLREFMKDVFEHGAAETRGMAVAFDLKSVVERNDARMNLKAQGRMVLPNESFEFREARWIADLELVDFPAALVREYAGRRIPIKSMSGHLAQRLHLDGSAAKQWRLKGDLEFRQLSIDAPELLLTPLANADGRTTFDVEWSRQRLQLSRADFRSNDMKFSLQGEVRSLDSPDPHFDLRLSALSAPLTAVRKYFPVKVLESQRLEKELDGIQAGQLEITQAGVSATLGELRRLERNGPGKKVWLDAELRDVMGKLGGEQALPVRGVQGRVKLENGVLAFQNIKGAYGDSSITDLDGSYDLAPERAGSLDLKTQGDFNLAELRELLTSRVFSEQAIAMTSSIQGLGGRSKVALALKRLPNAPIQFEGKASLENARLRYDDYNLSEVRGEINFSPKEIKGEKIRALFSGSPVQIRLAVTDYASDNGAFDLAIESTGVKAGVITSLLLDTGSLQDPGIVRGAVRYRGPLRVKEGRKFTGTLDLTNVQLSVQPLLQPLRELNGRIKIDEAGIDFENLKASLVGFPASANGRWRYAEKPQLLFDFAAPSLDVTYLISQIDPEASEFYANLEALGKITIAKGRLKNFEFTDLRTDTAIDHRVWRLTNLNARAAGGAIIGVTTIVDKPDTLGVVAEPKIQAVPIQSFLKWFDITNTEMTGRVMLTGKLETIGKNDPERKRNLTGAFNLRIEDGTIHRMRILVQILNLLDLSRWFTFQLPDLTKQGIRFRSITGDFKVTKGVYATENLLVDSNDLRMTGVGRIDVPKDEIDFIIAVRPFAGIDSVINQIPILGRGIAAIKNSFLVASFNITGRIDEPTITPTPLGTLSEMFWSVLGIPKNIIGLGDGEKKEEPKEPAKAPTK